MPICALTNNFERGAKDSVLDIYSADNYTKYTMRQNKIIYCSILAIMLGTSLLFLAAPKASSQSQQSQLVTVVDINEMIINPIVNEVIAQAINSSTEKGAQCLIIRLDTPGGLLETTHQIVKEIINAQIPVVVYVWPAGGRAASAGVFITMASHIAAMAESTHIGAAHPVIMNKSWGSIDQQTQEKVANDASAWIETLARNRNRNVQWAKRAVSESVSITEKEALKLGVIDILAKDLDTLLEKIDHKTVKTAFGKVTLRTKDAKVEFIPLSSRQKLLNQLINPNLAYILMLLGFFGLLYEITHPGFGFPGLAGIISLLLAFYAFQVLPTNYAGLFLIILGISFFIIEAFTPTFGAFTLAGVVSLIFGSTILFNQPYDFLKISLKIIVPVAISLGLISTFLITRIIKAHRRKAISGKDGLVGQIGLTKTAIFTKGKVFIHGELWDAQSKKRIGKGEKVVIEEVTGLKLLVKEFTQV